MKKKRQKKKHEEQRHIHIERDREWTLKIEQRRKERTGGKRLRSEEPVQVRNEEERVGETQQVEEVLDTEKCEGTKVRKAQRSENTEFFVNKPEMETLHKTVKL